MEVIVTDIVNFHETDFRKRTRDEEHLQTNCTKQMPGEICNYFSLNIIKKYVFFKEI